MRISGQIGSDHELYWNHIIVVLGDSSRKHALKGAASHWESLHRMERVSTICGGNTASAQALGAALSLRMPWHGLTLYLMAGW